MSLFSLFFQKVRNEFDYYWKIIKSIIDWSVFVYIVIPAVICLVGCYVYSLMNVPKNFIHFINTYLFFILIVYTLIGRVKTYVEFPDSIFLMTNKKFLKKIILSGLTFSFIKMLIINTLVFSILYPFLKGSNYNISLLNYISLITMFQFVISLCLYQWQILCSNKILNFMLKVITIVFAVYHISVFLYNSPYIYLAVAFDICIIIVILVSKIQTKNIRIDKEIDREQKQSNRMLGAILQRSGAFENINPRPNKFLKKNRFIFKGTSSDNILLDSFFKTIFRNFKTIKMFLQFLAYLIIAIFLISNTWMKEIVLILSFISLRRMVNNEWFLFIQNLKGKVIIDSDSTYKKLQQTISYPLVIFLLVIGTMSTSLYSLKEAIVLFLANGLLLFIIKNQYAKDKKKEAIKI